MTSARHFARSIGWILLTVGICTVAVAIPVLAWLSRNDTRTFDHFADWANVAALTVSAVGVALVLVDRLPSQGSGLSEAARDDLRESLAREASRQYGLTRAQLLGTNSLEERAIPIRLEVVRETRQKSRASKSQGTVTLDNVDQFFAQQSSPRLLATGPQGSGKTILALTMATRLLSGRTRGEPVPVLCRPYSWNPDSEPINAWIVRQLVQTFNVSGLAANNLVEDRAILPIIDGIDELASDGSPSRLYRAVDRINDYLAIRPDSPLIVTCRSHPNYVGSAIRALRGFRKVKLMPLSPMEIKEHIQTQLNELERTKWSPILRGLETPATARQLKPLLQTPWKLSAAISFAKFGGDPSSLLVNKQESISSTEIDAPVADEMVGAFVESRISMWGNSRLSPAKTMMALRAVATLQQKARSRDRKLNDAIILHNWWRVVDERRTLRAQFVVMWIMMHIPIGTLSLFPDDAVPELSRISALAILVNYGTIQIGAFALIGERQRALRVRLSNLYQPRSRITTVIAGVLAVTVGMLAASTSGALYGIAFGATGMLLFSLMASRSSDHLAQKPDPRAIIKNDRNFSIAIGLASSGYFALYYLNLYGYAVATIFSCMIFLAVLGSSAYARYIAATYVGLRFGIPARLGQFLEGCSEAGVLRSTGIGFEFRHLEIRHYFESSHGY